MPKSDDEDEPIERLLLAPEAAKILRLTVGTLAKHRVYGTGPTYRKNGGRVVYTLHDVQAWSRRGVRRSTRDPFAVPMLPAKPHAAQSAARQEHGDDE
ncbi:AlpA family transcriptional regulator [Caulobacter sp. UNC279MFTsu5.1]|uniref:helix-turn-helix transcriptional regulator n=1 Tax=Caulobacter sp. UNC279MFTsu5.1 TaxID=1502775 RepID=UPI0008E1A19B|nr:transcriptional regulator [Caulobacter sp. UNC279MFTsu5.1]SFI52111.1 transcriptional regulator, AlpA family [Caulobacter sp. UNC279MFTsu5.1]